MGKIAIIDNSTLTAVQRLCGDIEVVNKYSLDGDILCLENLVQAILFNEELYYIDDYKEQFKLQREKRFGFINPITFKKDDYELVLSKTREEMAGLAPTVYKGDYADSIYASFFKMLKMNNIFTWDLCNSVFYLTQKMLRDEKNVCNEKEYNALQQMIFGETTDYFEREKNPKHVILDSNGNELRSNELRESEQTRLFLSDLSWLGFRTLFYTAIANQTGGNLILHPIRNAFQINFLNKTQGGFNHTYNALLDAMNKASERKILDIYKPVEPVVSKYILPMFSLSIIDKVNSIEDLINATLHMKYEGKFVEARRQLEEIDELMQNNSAKGLREANRTLSRVNKTMEEVGQKYNVSTPQGVPLSPIIEAFNIGAALTGNSFPTIQELDISSRLLSKGKQFIPQKGFNSIYKSIANELATIGKLGNYYEKLTKNVNFSDKAHYYSAKIEESKYKNASSFWKKPMSVLC